MITIVTPALNSANFIKKNIKSILELKMPFEHIIVDGGSTDGTLDIISAYKHVKLLHQKESTGMYGAIHLGFEKAKGDLITWVNSDDVILAEGFKYMYDEIQTHKNDIVYSNAYFINIKGDRIKNITGHRFAKYFLNKGIFPFAQPASIYTKELYNKVGGLDFYKFKIAGDLDLFHKFSSLKNVKFKKCNVYSIEFLKHGQSLGDKNTNTANNERDNANIPRPNYIIKVLYKLLKI